MESQSAQSEPQTELHGPCGGQRRVGVVRGRRRGAVRVRQGAQREEESIKVESKSVQDAYPESRRRG